MSRDVCYICGNKNRDVLERHHIVPRRFGGSDDKENLVQLCSNCHTSVERLYDKRFYDELGVAVPENGEGGEDHVCMKSGCTSEETSRMESQNYVVWVCAYHKECAFDRCLERGEKLLEDVVADKSLLVCHRHERCERRGCYNANDTVLVSGDSQYDVLCRTHAREAGVSR